MTIDTTELQQIFQSAIDEIDEDHVNNDKLQLDSHILFTDIDLQQFEIFETYDTARTRASELAKNNPGQIIPILRVIERVGFMPY